MTNGAAPARGVLSVFVSNFDDQPLTDANVAVRPDRVGGSPTELSYDPARGAYVASDLEAGRYVIRVTRRGRETQERRIRVSAGSNHETVVLGERGMRYLHRGPVRMPFQPRADQVALKLRRPDDEDALVAVDRVRQELNLRPDEEIPEQAREDGALVFTVPPDRVPDALAALEQVEGVAHAGAIVAVRERSISFLTNELLVRLQGHPSEEEVRRWLADAGVEVLRAVPYAPGTYHVAVPGPASYEVLDVADRIAERDEVEWVEPNLVTTVELDQVTPTDFLWPGVWDRQLVGTPDAWGQLEACELHPFGSPEIVIAFVDEGIVSVGGVPAHPEFQGEVSDGSSKVFVLYDFRTLVPNNDNPPGDHGMGVSGVGAAKANNDAIVAGQREGLAGAAPNCRVMGLIYPAGESDILDMYVWAAGFDPGSPRPGFPPPLSRGADVFSTSIGFGSGSPISGQAAATFDFLVANGRGGRGCLCFFSAGNDNNEFTTHRPWAAYANTFGMAASTLDDDGITEIRAPYSGFGPAELCAPSHDESVGGKALHNPPINYGTWSASFIGGGNLVGHAGVQTVLSLPAAAGDTQLTVLDANNFLASGQVLVGLPGTPGSEPAAITGAPNVPAGTIPVSALMNPHAVGSAVVSGQDHYRNDFGGTSSATPLAAGVAALVLSANPDLTFAQARQILRDTAVKIDAGNADPVGQWLDEDNNPALASAKPPFFSRWYGHGRVNAEAAVREAAMRTKKPEKVTYRYIVKFFCGKSDGDVLAMGRYFTAVNVHNPSDEPVRIRKKLSTALPGERPGHVIDAGHAGLEPCESFEIDCADIYGYARMTPGCLLKGFLILEATSPLEVVAVYSAAGADEHVESIHTVQVPPHRLAVRPEQVERPDLLPVPPFEENPGAFPTLFCKSRQELAAIVRNQGEGAAPASKLQVDFLDCGQVVVLDVPPLAAGQDSPVISIPIPEGCWQGEVMSFRVTANATLAFEESDTTNNSVQSGCLILL